MNLSGVFVQKQEKSCSKLNNQNGTIALIDNKFVKVSKLKSLVKIKPHRASKGLVTISRHSSGKYYVSLLCKEVVDFLKNNYVISIDLGIIDVAIFSNDQKIDNNKFTSKMEKKLKHEQHKLSDVRYYLKIKVSIFLKLKTTKNRNA